jgi:hypothetical protein
MSGFLYKERQVKQKVPTINGVLAAADYSRINTNPEIAEKIRKESNKRPR